MLCALTKIKLEKGDVESVKFLLDEASEILDSLLGAEPVVYATVYLVKAEYHNRVGPASSFYEAALQYLAYTPAVEIKKETASELATNLALAALVGEGVYNFGEVLATPILSSIKDTPTQWLGDLLLACNSGDIKQFNNLLFAHSADIAAQPALSANMTIVRQKVCLMALVELVFHRPANNRVIAFADIATATALPHDQVEWLVMKGMSIGLIKGVMDEVEQVVKIAWVQPRVLDEAQLNSLENKLSSWAALTHETYLFVEDNVAELLN
jgi:26S proteasome regulatory subunit N9